MYLNKGTQSGALWCHEGLRYVQHFHMLILPAEIILQKSRQQRANMLFQGG